MADFLPPKGIYNSVKDWVESKGLSCGEALFNQIYPASSFSRKIKRSPARYPNELEGGSIGVIPNGRIYGLNGAVITPDNQLIWDVSLEYVHPRESHSIFQNDRLPPVSMNVDRATDLTHVVGGNYYHWIYEVLPRIHLVKTSGIDPGCFIVKSEPNDLPFQLETLELMGISEEKVIKTDGDFHLQAENLNVPSQPSFATKWGYDFLRKTLLPSAEQTADKKIYIRRRWARRITNEEDLMVVLEQFGFETVDLETLSVEEQIQLFSSAQVIIAAHGAGLANLTFCQPKTTVIEIFSPTYITCLYWVISSFGDLRHYYFIGDFGGKDPIYSSPDWTGMDNITINLRKFIALLKTLRI